MKLCNYQLQTGDRVEFQSEAQTLTGIVAATRWSPPGGRVIKAVRCIDRLRRSFLANVSQTLERLFHGALLGQERKLVVLDGRGRIHHVPAGSCRPSPKVTGSAEINAHAALSRANAAVVAAQGAIGQAKHTLHPHSGSKTLAIGLCSVALLQIGGAG